MADVLVGNYDCGCSSCFGCRIRAIDSPPDLGLGMPAFLAEEEIANDGGSLLDLDFGIAVWSRGPWSSCVSYRPQAPVEESVENLSDV